MNHFTARLYLVSVPARPERNPTESKSETRGFFLMFLSHTEHKPFVIPN